MRYENPLYMAEDAGAADLIAGGRLQLGISRGSPEQVIDGFRYFGYAPAGGRDRRRHGAPARRGLPRGAQGRGLRASRTRGRCSRIRPASCASSRTREGLRDRIWWGAASDATAIWAAKLGMNLQSSTLKFDESGEPLHVQQRKQIEAYRAAWKEAGHEREPRVSVSRSIFALVDDRDRAYFGHEPGRQRQDRLPRREHAGDLRPLATPRSPTCSSSSSPTDEAIAAADTLLLTVPNQLGVDYNAHAIESILKFVAPELGWR